MRLCLYAYFWWRIAVLSFKNQTVSRCHGNVILCVLRLLFFLPPCHQGEEEVEMSSTELLYQGILPSLPQYMVSAACGFHFKNTFYTVVLWIIWLVVQFTQHSIFIIYTFTWFLWINVSLNWFCIKATIQNTVYRLGVCCGVYCNHSEEERRRWVIACFSFLYLGKLRCRK